MCRIYKINIIYMNKTIKKSSLNKKNKSIKNSTKLNKDKLIILTFLEMLNTIKLYHWKTHSYSTHKATDELYKELNVSIDNFVEVFLGKDGRRVNLQNVKQLKLNDFNSLESFKKNIEKYKTFLIQLDITNNNKNSDLYNIRDEILGQLNKFTYLLTFNK